MKAEFAARIRQFEGFASRAVWDHAQYSNGFGTRARFPGEVIDRPEANRRFEAEIKDAASLVDRFAPGLDDGTKAALTSLTYNAGTRWMSSGLGDAIKAGDLAEARNRFLQYTKAGGKDLPGLVTRRLEEAMWFADQTRSAPVIDASLASPTTRVVSDVSNRGPGVHITAARSDRENIDGLDSSFAAHFSRLMLAIETLLRPSNDDQNDQSVA